MSKKLHIKTYGCQMNVYDSVRMGDVLAPEGYSQTDAAEDADFIILNTCHIREKASEKVYSELGRLQLLRQRREAEGKSLMIAVAGCVAQAEGEEMLARAPYIDMVIGSQSYHHLPSLIAQRARTGKPVYHLEFPEEQKFDLLPESQGLQGVSAFVSVQEGCDKFCSFCVVPYTRGTEYSRPVSTVIAEVQALVEKGALEITLLGQNVNAYHGEGADGKSWDLSRLLYAIADAVPQLKRLRYTTSHPNDMHEGLFRAHGEIEMLMPFLHLPIQSGSNRMLKAMNRKHTADAYLTIIEKLRAARPDIALSSDFIVGFPGESERDFEETLKLIETVGFAQAYSFKYSARPGTPAAESEEQLSEDEKIARLATLQQWLARQQESFNRSKVGQVMPVLFTREGRKEGQHIGKTPYLQSVYIDGAVDIMDRLVDIRIEAAYANSLRGELVQPAAPDPASERHLSGRQQVGVI
jgi:tRNA-2-methylthio-N6-dimethylallyladenosine synthase